MGGWSLYVPMSVCSEAVDHIQIHLLYVYVIPCADYLGFSGLFGMKSSFSVG